MVQGVRVLLLSSHRVGSAAGVLGSLQLQWLAQRLQCSERRDLPLVVALHHPPIAIGDAGMDAIRLLELRPDGAVQHRVLRWSSV
jgi:Icc protein